ncbi:potassium transporter TrkA [Halosimplex sp. TS25]|uniref:potassium transporter TrkA n=1 Tax=Halosimplex rarum TaxID=3396619 RepID=UPI0039EBFBEE
MTSLPVEVLIGISFGVLIGIVPAFVVGLSSFLLGYYGGRDVPRVVAIGVGLPIAAANGYYVGLIGRTVEQAPRLLVGALVAVMVALYANSQGAALAERVPRNLSQATQSQRTLSAEAVDAVDGSGQITIRTSGAIRDIEGHPPLSPDLRRTLENGAWRLPADLPLSELETRLADQLRTDYDLVDASVSIDARGRASIAAAPPSRDLAERVPDGWRAVSIDALLPTGLAPGDEVTVEAGSATASGHVLSASVDPERGPTPDAAASGATPTDGEEGALVRSRAETEGGQGRVTVALPTSEARSILGAERGQIRVTSHGTSHTFEAFSELERAGQSVRKVRLEGDGAALDDVEVIGVRGAKGVGTESAGWEFQPDEGAVEAAAEAFVVGDVNSEAMRTLAADADAEVTR